MRKCASKFGEHATDIVRESGRGTLTVVSLNAKGVWSRKYAMGKELVQPNAAGELCKTTAWWDGERPTIHRLATTLHWLCCCAL